LIVYSAHIRAISSIPSLDHPEKSPFRQGLPGAERIQAHHSTRQGKTD